MSQSYLRGKMGEEFATNYLISKGNVIIKRNFHTRYGEIDIISQDGDFLTFVEVKTRLDNSLGTPAEAVTLSKQRKIILSAVFYMQKYSQELQPRFDVVEIICKKGELFNVKQLKRYKSAFIPNEKNMKGLKFF